MPIKRLPTPDELNTLQQEGYDTTQIPQDGLMFYTPEERQQQQLQQEGSKMGMGGAALATAKAHAGSYLGGAAVGLPLMAALGGTIAAPFTGGASLATWIPALGAMGLIGAGSYAGSRLGQAGQNAILPADTTQNLEHQAAVAQAAYPKTAMATDILSSAALQGGKPSFAVPRLAAQGLAKGLLTGTTGKLLPEEVAAIRNVGTMNAANLGVNAATQLGTTGKIDPTELAMSGLAGVVMSQPNAIGRKILKWEPLSSNPQRSQVPEEGVTFADGNMERVQQYEARRKQAMQEGQQQWDQQQQLDERRRSEEQAATLAQQKQQDRKASFEKYNWLTPSAVKPTDFAMGDQSVKKVFRSRLEDATPVTKDMPDDQIRSIKAGISETMKGLTPKQMRQELYEQDFASVDPEGYSVYKQQEATKAAAAKQQQEAAQQQFLAQIKAKQQADQDIALAPQRAAEAAKVATAQQLQALPEESLAARAAQAQRDSIAQVQRREAFVQAEREAEAQRQRARSAEIEAGLQSKFQAGTQTYPTREAAIAASKTKEGAPTTPELQQQAANVGVGIGRVRGSEPLIGSRINPQTGAREYFEAGGSAPDPKDIGERLILLSRASTKDTGYHELLHQTLLDMDRSGDKYMMDLADRMRRVHAGEENLSEKGGQQYQQQVEGRKGMMARAGSMFKDVYAGLAARFGTENPNLLRRNLIAIARMPGGEYSQMVRASNARSGVVPRGTQYATNINVTSGEDQPTEFLPTVNAGKGESVSKGTDVTKLPSYDQRRDFTRGDAGNYWMTRGGTMVPVKAHIPFASEFLESHGVKLGASESPHEGMFRQGFNRVVIGHHTIHVEPANGNSLSTNQLKMLKDYAIENGRSSINVEYENPRTHQYENRTVWSRELSPDDSGTRYQPLARDGTEKDIRRWQDGLYMDVVESHIHTPPEKREGGFRQQFVDDIRKGKISLTDNQYARYVRNWGEELADREANPDTVRAGKALVKFVDDAYANPANRLRKTYLQEDQLHNYESYHLDNNYPGWRDNPAKVLPNDVFEEWSQHRAAAEAPARAIADIQRGADEYDPSDPDNTRYQPVVKVEDVLEPQEGRTGKQGYYNIKDPRLGASSVHIDDKAIHIINLAVPEGERNKGVGSEVLGKMKQLSESLGKPIELTAHPDTEAEQSRLNKFYSRNGFTEGENRVWRYEPQQQGDTQRYNELTQRMRTASSEERSGIWQEIEGIKNRNGGLPPMDNTKYQPLGNHTDEETPIAKEAAFKYTQAAVDKIRAMPHDNAREVGDAVQQTLAKKQNLLGSWINPVMHYRDILSSNDAAQLHNILYAERENQAHSAVPPRLREAYNAIRRSLIESQNNQIRINEPVQEADGKLRLPKIDPYYYPTTTEPKIADVMRQGVNNAEEQRLSKIFIDHQVAHKATPEQAAQRLKDWVDSLRSSVKYDTGEHGNQLFYNANRRAEGIPLPKEFMRQDLWRNLQAYFMRKASDNAFYEHMESKPRIAAALGYNKDAWGNPIDKTGITNVYGNDNVRAVMNMLRGEGVDKTSMGEHAVESIASAAMLGPLTEAHKTVSTIAKGMSMFANPMEAAKGVIHAVNNLGSGWFNPKATATPSGSYGHTLETGYHIYDAKSATDFLNTHLTTAERMRGIATGLRSLYTMGGLTERFTKSMAQGMMEYLVPSKIAAARNGDAAAVTFMKHVDPEWTPTTTYTDKQQVAVASEMANLVHGTKDARTLPAWMLHDNEISAFAKLLSWNIAQTNTFMRDVVTPARRGDYGPLLMSTLGAALGGYVLTKLRESIAAKRSGVPSFSEIAASDRGVGGNLPAVFYQAAAMASFAGFAGIFSTVARWPFDVAFRNSPPGTAFPLDEELTSLVNTGNHVFDALVNDPTGNWMTIGANGLVDLAKNNIQLARVAINHAADMGLLSATGSKVLTEIEKQKATSDKTAELRRFKQVSGYMVDEQGGDSTNPYMNLEQRRFKREQDIPSALQELPDLIHNIVAKFGDKPDVMLSKLKALKSNSTYETMPSFEDTPMVFLRYLKYLKAREGDDAATNRMMDYMQHKVVNQTKSSLVP